LSSLDHPLVPSRQHRLFGNLSLAHLIYSEI
jgi:hypothetical protein